MRRLLLLILLSSVAIPTASASAVGLPSTWDKGFTFSSWWHNSVASSGAAVELDKLKATGANSVALMTTWYQASSTANSMAPDLQRSPDDASLTIATQRAKARGLKVALRPMVGDAGAGVWRGSFAPSSPSTWFANYRNMINHYAVLAQKLGIDTLEIGSELSSLTRPTYDAQWRTLIADVRARFSGRILYAANWDEYQHVTFFDALDVIGIDAYFPLASGATPGEDDIVAAWSDYTDRYGTRHRYLAEIAAVQAKFNKPVLFTEIGYASGPNNLSAPWAFGTSYDAGAQQRALVAAFRAFSDKPWFQGMWVWEWQADPALTGKIAGGVGDLGHTPQGKPAQDTLTQWFTASSPTVAPAPAPAPEPAPAPAPAPAPEPAPEPAPAPAPAPEPAPAPVNAAPTVALVRPVEGTIFNESLTMTATASDDSGVTRVDFRVDGRLVKSVYSAPYTVSWRAHKKLAYGAHTVTATAYDAAGNSASDTVSVERSRSATMMTAASVGSESAGGGRKLQVHGKMLSLRSANVRVSMQTRTGRGSWRNVIVRKVKVDARGHFKRVLPTPRSASYRVRAAGRATLRCRAVTNSRVGAHSKRLERLTARACNGGQPSRSRL